MRSASLRVRKKVNMFARLNVLESGERCCWYEVTLSDENGEYADTSLFQQFVAEFETS